MTNRDNQLRAPRHMQGATLSSDMPQQNHQQPQGPGSGKPQQGDSQKPQKGGQRQK